MNDTNEKKAWKTRSQYSARDVRIMKIDEPKQVRDDLTLCSFSFVHQTGKEGEETWVRVTGANGLAERIFNSKVGDRVNVFGFPSFRAYMSSDGTAKVSMDVKYPEIDFLTRHDTDGEVLETPVVETVTEEPRRPVRPKKLPFQQ